MIKNVFDVNVRGHPSPVTIDINRFFACIIAGPSGSGKSTFLRRLLGLISFHDTDAEAYFLDFKADEEMFSMTSNHVARGFDCIELFEIVYQRFEARLSKQEENSHNLYLIFDEWQAFLAYIEQTDKKKHKDVLSKMLMLNSMGRSLGCPVLPENIYKQVIETIKEKTMIFAYYDDAKYLSSSKYLNVLKLIDDESVF